MTPEFEALIKQLSELAQAVNWVIALRNDGDEVKGLIIGEQSYVDYVLSELE